MLNRIMCLNSTVVVVRTGRSARSKRRENGVNLKYQWVSCFRCGAGQGVRAEINKNYIFVWPVSYNIRFVILRLVMSVE